MAVSQYIGARYVPLIYQNPDDNSNNWKQGVTYDPLTIVSYAGGSYTSKTFVPATAANPIDAPQYWVSIGLYSGQTSINTNSINQIRHAIAAATEAGDIATVERSENDFVWVQGVLYRCTAAIHVDDHYTEGINVTPIDDIAAAVYALNTTVSNLSDAVSDMEDEINIIRRTAVSPYTLCIGDSYAEGYSPDGNNSGWPTYLFNLGVRGESLYRGGAGFHYASSDNKSFLNMITNATLTVPDNQIDRIVVCAGYNDIKDRTDNRAHIREFIAYCISRFVNAKIYIGFCGYAWSNNENNITANELYAAIRDYEAACRQSKAVFMPQTTGVLLGTASSMASDHKHPNDVGNKAIADAIFAAFSGCSFESAADYTISLENTPNGIHGNLSLSVTVIDGTCTFRAKATGFNIDRSTAFSMYLQNFTPTASFPLITARTSLKVAETVHIYDKTNGLSKDYYVAPCYMFLNAPEVLSVINIINDAGNNYGSTKHFELNDNTYYTTVSSFL